MFTGIGEKKAKKIVDVLGKDTLKIINAEIENNIFKALNNDQVKGTVISRG